MSTDCSVSMYFPMSQANAALEAIRKVLRRPKYRLGILVKAPLGEPVRIHATCVLTQGVEVRDNGGETRWIKVPTISPVFPEVIGPEPIFSLEELNSLSYLDVEIAFRQGGKVVDYAGVSFNLERGREFLAISFGAQNNRDADDFFMPRFRSRFESVMVQGGAVLATYLVNGEWFSFADQSPIDDPQTRYDDAEEMTGPDEIVAALWKGND